MARADTSYVQARVCLTWWKIRQASMARGFTWICKQYCLRLHWILKAIVLDWMQLKTGFDESHWIQVYTCRIVGVLCVYLISISLYMEYVVVIYGHHWISIVSNFMYICIFVCLFVLTCVCVIILCVYLYADIVVLPAFGIPPRLFMFLIQKKKTINIPTTSLCIVYHAYK